MGLDIYLEWEKQTENEHQKQITGFSIDKGHYGYLRASYSMPREISLYSNIFYSNWKGFNEETDFNFLDEKNLEKCIEETNLYLKEEPDKFKVIIVKSVIDFFNLGVKKNKEGLKTIINFN